MRGWQLAEFESAGTGDWLNLRAEFESAGTGDWLNLRAGELNLTNPA